MSQYIRDARGNWVPVDQAMTPVQPAPMVDAGALLRVLTEAETGRGEVLGQIVFSAAWGVFAALGDVALVHAADTGPELALLGLGTALVAWSTIRARGLLLDVVEIVNRWSAKTERSRILLEHAKQRHATRRTVERRVMLEIAAREAADVRRAVELGEARRRDGDTVANQLHRRRQELIELLAAIYENAGGKWQGHQPFSLKKLGRPRFEALRDIGLVEMRGTQPQIRWDFAEDEQEALSKILELRPDYLELPEG